MSSKPKSPSPNLIQTTETIPVNQLWLDARNPRLVQYGLRENAGQDEVLKLLWQRMAVDEVAYSIAASGYWPHEHLLVATEGGKNVVIEGNRRLAAVLILLDGDLRRRLRATDLPALTPRDRARLEKEGLPAVRIDKREDLWQYLGFKHVNGPAKWTSYAKAQYIAFVRKAVGVPLEKIAEQIGDKHRTVQRLYRALTVIEQAEETGVWKREFCYKGQLAFSYLMTALDYEGFARFLDLKKKDEESPRPVNPTHLKALGEICIWLWGDNRSDTPPVVQTQNPHLRMLDSVLSDPSGAALRALRRGDGLEAAFELSKGDVPVFREALQDAKRALMKAQARASTGFHGEEDVLELARHVATMASDLLEFMDKLTSPLRHGRGRASLEARK